MLNKNQLLEESKVLTPKIFKLNLPLIKSLLKGSRNSSGRNNLGKITVYHKGGGHKKRYRKIDFRQNLSSTSIITSIEYDPNRNCSIVSIYDLVSKVYKYKLAPKGSCIGDIIKTGTQAELRLGHSMLFKKIPIGSCLHCVSLKNDANGIISRAAGTFSILRSKTSLLAEVKISSGKVIDVPLSSYAAFGAVSNNTDKITVSRKAGRSRWKNIRPTVRGVAMNPIDHPHGGGEGKTSGGRTSVTPWGKPGKGKKTASY